MESVHQIITIILSDLNLPKREVDGWCINRFKAIKWIEYQLLKDFFTKDEYRITMHGEIYQ